MHVFRLRHADGARRLIAVVSSVIVLQVGSALGATYTVSSLGDTGAGSLRDALDQANRNVGADIVAFQAGLTGTIVLTGGQIDIFDGVTINGPGTTKLSVSGSPSSRAFSIYPPVGTTDVFTVAINGLKFINGSSIEEGGAILVGDSSLSVSNCEFRNNSALRGGAIYAFPVNSATALTIQDSLFDGNNASVDGGAFGAQDIDSVSISNVVASNNSAVRNGGGGFLRAVTTVVANSRFESNHAATSPPGVGGPSGGGALRIDGSKPTATTSLNSLWISANTSAFGWGGGLSLTVGTATLDRVQLTSNSANSLGGAVSAYAIALAVNNSTMSANSSNQSGGAIAFDVSGSLSLMNSSLSGNGTSTGNGGGIYSGSNTTLTIVSSTLVGNSAASGGGIRREGGNASLRNTIAANNIAGSGPDLSGNFLPNYCLVKNTSGATLGAGSGNLASGIDPLLGALAVNGGPTLTLMPSAGSPVINTGDVSGTGLPLGDQRGLQRIAGGRVDIGAVERQSPEDVIFRGVFQ